MKSPINNLLMYLLLLLITACSSSDADPVVKPPPMPLPPVALNYELWEIADLSDSLIILGANRMVFMDETAMSGTYLELASGENDDRGTVSGDELYYIHEGSADLMVDAATTINVQAGDVIFTKSGSNARFISITNDLKVVITGMKTPSAAASPASQLFSQPSIESTRSAQNNVWNPFVNFTNVTLGLYMLPQASGGDSRLVHTWEELNIVTSGNCRFTMDTDNINVGPGSIFFVKEGNGHFFNSLSSDTDILILWEQP